MAYVPTRTARLPMGLPDRRYPRIRSATKTATGALARISHRGPRPVLLNPDHGEVEVLDRTGLACGFYWTEGVRGLGWAVDAIPTLKGGSTIGIPSPPAIWRAGSGSIVTPDLRDAERIQGFPSEWTAPADRSVVGPRGRRTDRWKLVGNAVSVPVARWLGERLLADETYERTDDGAFSDHVSWPSAAWGDAGERRRVDVSMWPIAYPHPHLHEFLEFEPKLLSSRATAGFLRRASRGTLRIPEDLICEAEAHLAAMDPQLQVA